MCSTSQNTILNNQKFYFECTHSCLSSVIIMSVVDVNIYLKLYLSLLFCQRIKNVLHQSCFLIHFITYPMMHCGSLANEPLGFGIFYHKCLFIQLKNKYPSKKNLLQVLFQCEFNVLDQLLLFILTDRVQHFTTFN